MGRWREVSDSESAPEKLVQESVQLCDGKSVFDVWHCEELTVEQASYIYCADAFVKTAGHLAMIFVRCTVPETVHDVCAVFRVGLVPATCQQTLWVPGPACMLKYLLMVEKRTYCVRKELFLLYTIFSVQTRRRLETMKSLGVRMVIEFPLKTGLVYASFEDSFLPIRRRRRIPPGSVQTFAITPAVNQAPSRPVGRHRVPITMIYIYICIYLGA